MLESFPEIVGALECIADDQSQKGDTVRETTSISGKMQEFEFVLMLVVWQEILQKFHLTSKALQQEELHLGMCGDLYQSLAAYLTDMRKHFHTFQKTAKNMLPNVDYKESRRKRRKRQDNDGHTADVTQDINAREKFRVFTFCSIIDILTTETERNSKVYKDLSARFSYLTSTTLPEEEYSRCSHDLVTFYHEDLSIDTAGEVKQFQNYLQSRFQKKRTYFTHAKL